MRWKISSSRGPHAHLHALLVSPDIPGAFNCAAMKIASLTSLFVMLMYSRSLFCGHRLIGGLFAICDGSGKRCSLRVAHFSKCTTAGGWFSPWSIGGDCHAPPWFDPTELCHAHTHLT